MDPNETIDRIRAMRFDYYNSGKSAEVCAARLASLIGELDVHLCTGGELPTDWSPGQRTVDAKEL